MGWESTRNPHIRRVSRGGGGWGESGPPRTAFSLALCISAAAVLVLGIAPRSVLAFVERSILSLLM